MGHGKFHSTLDVTLTVSDDGNSEPAVEMELDTIVHEVVDTITLFPAVHQ
ncbi:MAG: hypothetical protein ABW047_07850 [Nitrospiraceae bacterium]